MAAEILGALFSGLSIMFCASIAAAVTFDEIKSAWQKRSAGIGPMEFECKLIRTEGILKCGSNDQRLIKGRTISTSASVIDSRSSP
jgi:hypothetical protein